MDKRELERKIALKYRRITGTAPIGLIDVLHILTGPDLREDLQEYLNAQESE